MQDRKYISRFQNGDFEAFGYLYDSYIDNIFAFVYRKTSDKQVAEDITSQVWMKALKSLEFFGEKENANFKSWIYCIANNTVIDYYRTKKELVDSENISQVWISSDFAAEIDAKDKLKEVVKYLDTLKPLEREIVTLRIWDDLGYKEISRICWEKQDNCKQIFSRTMKKLQANLWALILLLLIL